MRIGIDARILGHPRSGIAVYVINLVEQFLKHKDLEIVLFGDRPICEEYLDIVGDVKTVIFGQQHRKRWAQFYLPWQLKRHRVDVYHATWNNAAPVFTSVPSVLTIHDIIPFVVDGYFKNWRRRLKYIFSMRSALCRAKAIITDAENTKADLIKHFNVSADKIKVIGLGISQMPNQAIGTEKTKTVLNKFKIKSDYIVNIGSFDKRRNLGTLIRAFGRFIKNTAVGCQLVLIGGYDNFPKELGGFNSLVNGLNLDGKVIFTNHISQEEKTLLLYMAKMMVHLSLYEGFCFPVLEAMQAGIPIIAYGVGSVPEVAQDAVILVDPRNEEEAALAMQELWGNKSLSDSLVEKGLSRIKNFSWEKTAKETLNIYKEVLSEEIS